MPTPLPLNLPPLDFFDNRMAALKHINHVTLIVDDFEKACAFYEHELGLEPLPAFEFDYPTQFYKLNERQQIHLSEWDDTPSFRGHICLEVDDFNPFFYRMKALNRIDIQPWGRVRRLPDGSMQMFVRDPSQNLLEFIAPPHVPIDDAIFEDELVETHKNMYISDRDDGRGQQSASATLYHENDSSD